MCPRSLWAKFAGHGKALSLQIPPYGPLFPREILMEPTESHSAELVLAVKHMLRASKSHPLRITIDQGGELNESVHPAIRLLVGESHRWIRENLFFECQQGLHNRQLAHVAGNLPLLECLKLEVPINTVEARLFAIAPRLRSVGTSSFASTTLALHRGQMRNRWFYGNFYPEATKQSKWSTLSGTIQLAARSLRNLRIQRIAIALPK